MQIDLTTEEANVMCAHAKYWLGAAQRKANAIRLMQVEAEEAQRELTISEQADVEHLNTSLPMRIAATERVLKKITESVAPQKAPAQ